MENRKTLFRKEVLEHKYSANYSVVSLNSPLHYKAITTILLMALSIFFYLTEQSLHKRYNIK